MDWRRARRVGAVVAALFSCNLSGAEPNTATRDAIDTLILQGERSAGEDFRLLGQDFIDTYRDHMKMEEQLFFPTAMDALCRSEEMRPFTQAYPRKWTACQTKM